MSFMGRIDLIWAVVERSFLSLYWMYVFNQESHITIKKVQLTVKEQLQNNKMYVKI